MNRILVLLFVQLLAFSAIAQEGRRFQVWNKNEIAIELWENVSLEVAEKIHYSPKENTLDLKFGEFYLVHEPKNWLEYGLGFRHSYSNLNNNWLQENRSMLFVSLSKEFSGFEISFSNRIEYRSYKSLEDHFRHKQNLSFEFPQLTEWGMKFYLAEESFHKLNGSGLHLARVHTGITAIETERFEMKVYYILEKVRVTEKWYSVDIFGLNLSFSI